MSHAVLWENEWIEVRLIDGWYTAIHGKKGDEAVSILGYRRTRQGTEFLIRKEHIPCNGDGIIETSVTGLVEHNESPHETAVKELREETGYSVDIRSLHYFDWAWSSKVSDTKIHLFAVDLTGLPQGKIIGDGSKGEESGSAIWVSLEDALKVRVTSIPAIIAHLAMKVADI